MGQPVIPNNPALQQQYTLAMQSNLLRAQASQMGGQVLLSPRLATPATSQQQALIGAAGLAPPLVSSADPASAGAMLYTTSSIPGMMAAPAAGTDLSQYGLMNQTALLDYQAAMDQSAAG